MGDKVTIPPVSLPDNSSFTPAINRALGRLSDEFDNVLYRDGSTSLSGNLNANHNSIYNLSAPTSDTQPLRLGDLRTLLGNDPLGDPLLRFDLASLSGAGLIGYRRTGVGAVVRTLQSKLQNFIDVTDYGAVGNGVTDDSAAIQAAINNNPGKRIVFPGGRYLINSSINITAASVTLDFCSRQATLVLGTQNMNGIVIGNNTEAAKNATLGTQILAPVFNVKEGIEPFTEGAAIFRNFCAFVDVKDPLIYGANSTGAKLYTGVYDYKAQDCDTPNALIQHVRFAAVHCKGDGTVAGRTVNCNYDNLRVTDFLKGLFIDEGCAGIGAYRPTVYGINNGGWGIHINCTPGPSGQNFFIDTPDIEAQPLAAGAMFFERGQKAMVKGGWIGASMNVGLRIGPGMDSCVISCDFNQSRVIVEGPSNTIEGGDIAGDITSTADGIKISGDFTTIGAGVTIRQWGGYGISWVGTPTNCLISNANFRNNGTDIAPTSAFSPTNAPVISSLNSDKLRFMTASASMTIPHDFVQIAGSTVIDTIVTRGRTRLTIQAGTGGITLSKNGNIQFAGTTLAVPAFATVSLICDGVTWFVDGRSF